MFLVGNKCDVASGYFKNIGYFCTFVGYGCSFLFLFVLCFSLCFGSFNVNILSAKMPKPLSSQSKKLVASLLNYFQRECENHGPLLPITGDCSEGNKKYLGRKTLKLALKVNIS